MKLWCSEWHWDRFLSKYFGFRLLVSFHQRSILICSSLLRPLEGLSGESWEPFQKKCSFGNTGALEKYIQICSSLNCECSYRSSIWKCLCLRFLNAADSRHSRYRSVVPLTSTASALCSALKGLRTINTVSKLNIRNKQKFLSHPFAVKLLRLSACPFILSSFTKI